MTMTRGVETTSTGLRTHHNAVNSADYVTAYACVRTYMRARGERRKRDGLALTYIAKTDLSLSLPPSCPRTEGTLKHEERERERERRRRGETEARPILRAPARVAAARSVRT